MKFKYIILTLALISATLLSACQSEEAPDQKVIDDFCAFYVTWSKNYQFEKEKLAALQKRTELMQQTADSWKIYQDSARNIIKKKEIVYIKRMASSSVMNFPSSYSKDYLGDVTTEKGQGAENEDLTVLYLSDGTIIKSSPLQNPEWLGTMVGEKVLKTSGKRLAATQKKLKYFHPDKKIWWSFGPHYTYFDEPCTHTLATAPDFKYEEYVTYQPLYSK